MDNGNTNAPIIPAGTEKTVFGSHSFQTGNSGQAGNPPDTSKHNSVEGEGTQQSSNQQASNQETTYQELAAKKGFKSADDLAKAYASLEKQNKRVEMGLSELAKARAEADSSSNEDLWDYALPKNNPNPQVNQTQQQVQNQPARDTYGIREDMSPEDAVKVVERIVKKATKPLEDKIALQNLFGSQPDAKNYASKMADIVKKEPGISWEAAYKLAKFDDLADTAKEEGKSEAYEAVQKKESVQQSGRTTSRSSDDGRDLSEIIKDRSIPFNEVQRIMKERFSQ